MHLQYFRRPHGQISRHETAQIIGHGGINPQAYDTAAAAALQRGLEKADQIFCLFLHFNFTVANDPEQAPSLGGIAGEELIQE